jgi:hypothetical protein
VVFDRLGVVDMLISDGHLNSFTPDGRNDDVPAVVEGCSKEIGGGSQLERRTLRLPNPKEPRSHHR